MHCRDNILASLAIFGSAAARPKIDIEIHRYASHDCSGLQHDKRSLLYNDVCQNFKDGRVFSAFMDLSMTSFMHNDYRDPSCQIAVFPEDDCRDQG